MTVRPITRVLPATMGCLWLAGAMSPVPCRAAGVFPNTQSDGFGTTLPGQPSGFGTAPPGQPSGFGTALPGQAGGSAEASATDSGSELGQFLLQGLKVAGSFSSYYNSNISPSQNVVANTTKDDFILGLGGSLNYLSKASDFTFGGSYRGNYNEYFNHPNLSGYSQGGGLLANYHGGRWTISGACGVSLDRGNNSNYSSNFVQQTTFSSSLTARYQLSPKTSLLGSFSQYATSATGGYSDTSSMTFDVSALWKYSPLTEIGPGVRYTYSTGSTQLGRSSIGPTFNLNYKLSQKVSLTSRVGMDFASYDNGATANPTISASLGLNYQASKLWGMDFTLYRDTQADPTVPGAYTGLTSARLGYHHKILRAMWNAGVSYQLNSTVFPGSSSNNGYPDRKYLSCDTSLSLLTFSNTTAASVFLQFNDQSGGSQPSWNSVQAGFSLSRSF